MTLQSAAVMTGCLWATSCWAVASRWGMAAVTRHGAGCSDAAAPAQDRKSSRLMALARRLRLPAIVSSSPSCCGAPAWSKAWHAHASKYQGDADFQSTRELCGHSIYSRMCRANTGRCVQRKTEQRPFQWQHQQEQAMAKPAITSGEKCSTWLACELLGSLGKGERDLLSCRGSIQSRQVCDADQAGQALNNLLLVRPAGHVGACRLVGSKSMEGCLSADIEGCHGQRSQTGGKCGCEAFSCWSCRKGLVAFCVHGTVNDDSWMDAGRAVLLGALPVLSSSGATAGSSAANSEAARSCCALLHRNLRADAADCAQRGCCRAAKV